MALVLLYEKGTLMQNEDAILLADSARQERELAILRERTRSAREMHDNPGACAGAGDNKVGGSSTLVEKKSRTL
jgi:hypothetical protein